MSLCEVSMHREYGYEWVVSHVCECVISHIRMSPITHMFESFHIWMRHVAHMNESCRTYAWVMSHVRMGHVTHDCIVNRLRVNICMYACLYMHVHVHVHSYMHTSMCVCYYRVVTLCRLFETIDLFCKRALQKRPIFCKRDISFFKEPSNRMHPIYMYASKY